MNPVTINLFYPCLPGFSFEESESQKALMQAKLTALEEQAYTLAGHPFSLSSPDDVAQVAIGSRNQLTKGS